LQKAQRFARQGLIRDKDEFEITTEGPWHQEVHQFGLNYRLPDILAALGSSQLTRIADFKSKRKELFELYTLELRKNLSIKLPSVKDFVDPFWHLFPIRVPADKRLAIFNHLRSNGINVQVNYLPVNRQPVFNKNHLNECPEAFNFYQCEISLPIFHDLFEFDLKSICKLLLNNLD
jgi:dTDP-4-amino-4,6-dideoxygalactose transaminase